MKNHTRLLIAVAILLASAFATPVFAQDPLAATPWQWVAFTSPVERFDVETPESYLLKFNADGTVAIVADCKFPLGNYTDDGGALTITVGPTTMELCPGESRADQFTGLLGGAARYFFEDGLLYIDLMADGGTMAFAPANPELLADDGEGAIAGAPSETSLLPVETLRNVTYSGIYDEPITLTDGRYEDGLYTVEYVDGAELNVDLDGDGVHDAAVFLVERGGGTASILFLAAQLNQEGQPVDAGAVRLDEVGIKQAEVGGGQVHLEIITAGPGDADCCVSHKARRSYALVDGRLADVTGDAGQELVRVSADDLNGTSWALVELNFGVPALPDVPVTLDFAGGKISGAGGCNNFSGSFTLGEENPFVTTVGPLASTMMACPQEIMEQESAFLAALGQTAHWSYEFGNLALAYVDEQKMPARLLFAPAAPEVMADDGAGATAGAALPPAEIANDEGGPEVVTGEWNYSSALVLTHFEEPSVVLANVSPYVLGDWSDWTPESGQILGRLTRPEAPSPATYAVRVPIRMDGASADVDNDGETDSGVQIYALLVASNLNGNSWIQQMDQAAYASYLTDPQTGAFRQGAFLVYAPDDAQGFPSSAGADGIYFTADDPAVGLPAGYTLATLGSDGKVTFDRAADATMDTLEEAATASPNFASQGILESYNSLLAMLKVRYSYTEKRGLDWDAIRQNYLPQVEAADAAGDMAAYYQALTDLAISIGDGHVYVNTSEGALKVAAANKILDVYGASVGAGGLEMDDGRYLINFVDLTGPAAAAGWQFGTEIVSVNGVPMRERIDALPLQVSAGNPEARRLIQAALALAFADGEEVAFEVRQPGETETSSVTLTAAGDLQTAMEKASDPALISYKSMEDGYGYVRWSMFREPQYTLAIWRKFLDEFHGAPGILIDLRGNGGGNAELMYTMASYFFPEEAPASYHWLDQYTYDEQVNDLVKEHAQDYPLYSPDPDLTYGGAVVVLVDEHSASAGEYFPQFLQHHGRALVVGEHGTDGAGGNVEQVAMPGGITFFFTKGRSYFAGTDELNLEAKGVTLDVRVPISAENEQAKVDGRDPVLEAGVAALGEEAARRGGALIANKPWRLIQIIGSPTAPIAPALPENYVIIFGEDGTLAIATDCNQVSAGYAVGVGGALTVTPGASTLAACPDGSIAERFVTWLAAATSFQADSDNLVILTDPASEVLGMAFEEVK
ncbi:MAG: META domain-containing protein [Caldilineaceae bacterium]|nr:META domain-containing protein [Caldilineaceae bacterium]